MFSAPSTFPTKTDATRFLAVGEADMARGLYIDPRAGRATFAEWSDRWLAGPGKREASTARDRQALASFRPRLGSVLLTGLTPGLIQEAVDLRSKVAAPATVARDFSALWAVLNAAVNADLILDHPLGTSRCLESCIRSDRAMTRRGPEAPPRRGGRLRGGWWPILIRRLRLRPPFRRRAHSARPRRIRHRCRRRRIPSGASRRRWPKAGSRGRRRRSGSGSPGGSGT
jgi:hypothetical protein